MAASACLAALSLSRASVEVYHVRRPEWVLDALPVSASAQLSAVLVLRAARTLAAGAAALVLRWLAGGELWSARVFASVALLVAVLAAGEVLSALGWVRWSHRRVRAQGLASLAAFAICVLVAGLLLADVVRPGGVTLVGRVSLLACGVLTAAVLTALAFAAHARWRAADAEFAKRLGARETWGEFVEWLAGRVCGGRRELSSQLARDLRLVLRGFSSAVYAAAGVAVLVVLLMAALLAGGARARGRGRRVARCDVAARRARREVCVRGGDGGDGIAAAGAGRASAAALLARTLGRGVGRGRVACEALPRARGVAPGRRGGVGRGGGVRRGRRSLTLLPLLAECVWLWWIVSTAAGGLSFEMPEQPGLALIVTLCAALAAGGISAAVWPIGLAVYAMGVAAALPARRRARAVST